MTDAPVSKNAPSSSRDTRFMREEIKAPLPPALDAALSAAETAAPGLQDAHAAAIAALRKTGLPHSKSEAFTFLRVAEFLPYLQALPGAGTPAETLAAAPTRAEIDALLFPECRQSHLVVVDGVYAPALSNPGPFYRVSLLEDVFGLASRAPLPPPLRQALLRAIGDEGDPAAALAMIFAKRPVLIQTPEKTAAAAPLQILRFHRAHQDTGPAGQEPRRRDDWLVFRATRLSESRVLVRDAGNAGSAMLNGQVHLFLEDGASVKWLQAAAEEASAPENHLQFTKLTARVDRNARLSVTVASTGSKLTRNAFAVDLTAPGAEAELSGATVLTGARQNHNHVDLRHLAANCASRQHFKTVAGGKAKSSVDGGIFVAEGAQQTNANQLINNLMLSDEARADSKPRLMIHADDVKCSHGATVGKLDAAQQFYLESRGLSPAQARTLLTVAFIDEVATRTASVSAGFHAYLERTLVDSVRKMPKASLAAVPAPEAP